MSGLRSSNCRLFYNLCGFRIQLSNSVSLLIIVESSGSSRESLEAGVCWWLVSAGATPSKPASSALAVSTTLLTRIMLWKIVKYIVVIYFTHLHIILFKFFKLLWKSNDHQKSFLSPYYGPLLPTTKYNLIK